MGAYNMGAYKEVALLLASATLISCSDGLTAVATPGGGSPAAPELGAGGNGGTDPGEPVVVSSGIVLPPNPITGETDVALLKVDVAPASASLMFGGQQQFTAQGVLLSGVRVPITTSWSAMGGTITNSGLYTAGNIAGVYRVVATAANGMADTSLVSVTAPVITSVTITPAAATLQPAETQQFTASTALSNGTTQNNASVNWTATGGTITISGLYTAGSAAGSYQVIGTAGGKADTSVVTISTSPQPTLTGVNLTPSFAALNTGQSQQFTAVGQMSDGSTSTITPTWTATGGTVTTSGRYTAGNTPGQFRVIAAASNGMADTSSVNVTAAAATVSSLTVTPGSASLQSGQTQQFTASAAMSDGTTQSNPTVTWSATGGTINSSGLYTAGSTGGTFRAIAASGGKADTAAITISVPPPPPSGDNSMFFNSSEAGCGTDANILLCDDFEDGAWYEKHCDAANSSGGLQQTDGWCGTIYNDNGLGAGTARCGGIGFKSNCAATTQLMTGSTTGNMADHALASGGVDEIWVRFYTKPLSGYEFGAEKMLTFNDGNPGDAGIKWGNLSWNCARNAGPTGEITMGFPAPMDVCAGQNTGNDITIQSGNWYFYEVHYKLSAPGQANGIFELWVDNCGPDGTACPATPTLRMRKTDVRNDRTSTSQLIRVLWFEAWSNPVSRGERLWDQIKVSKAGAIGFMP